MAQRSSRYTHVSLGSLEDKILLSESQLALLEKRRKRMNGEADIKPKNRVAPVRNPSKPPVVPPPKNKGDAVNPGGKASLGEEPTRTAPTVSSSSSGMGAPDAASSASGSTAPDPKTAFYGQGLKGKGKKLYDDTGASYYEESGSEASGATRSSASYHKKLENSSTALTEALTKSSSHESQNAGTFTKTEAASVAPSSNESSHSSKKHKDAEKKTDLKKRLLATMAEKRKAQGKEAVSSANIPDKSRNRRSSFGLNRPKGKNVPHDQQQAFLRNLMKGAINRPKEEGEKQEIREDASVSQKKNRMSLSNRQSDTNSAVRSGTNSSASSAKDKAVMRKVLERTERIRKKKVSGTSCNQNFVKSSSSRMKMLSSRSRTSDESANDERSVEDETRRSVTPSKLRANKRKTTRRERGSSSSRLLTAASRWSGASNADDEAESQSQPIVQDCSDSTEEVLDYSIHQETMVTGDAPADTEREEEVATSDKAEYAPPTVDVKCEATEVSALSRRSGPGIADETPIHSRGLKNGLTFDEECISNRYSLISRPSIINEDEIEVEFSGTQRFDSRSARKVARAVTESMMEPVDFESPKVNLDSNFTRFPSGATASTGPAKVEYSDQDFVDNDDPEGYAEFVATLKAEVAGSHALLWSSFHELFHGNGDIPPLSQGRSCHFDDKTKDTVTNMSTYLKKKNQVNCTVGTQLANDKTVRENATPRSSAGQPSEHQLPDYPQSEAYDSDKENNTDLQMSDPADRADEGTNSDDIEVTLGQFVRKSMGGVPPSVTENNVVRQTTDKPQQVTTDKPQQVTTDKPQQVTTERPQQIIPLKKSQMSNAPKPIASAQQLPSYDGNDTSPPWSGVKLRSVAEANKSEASNSSIPTSWTKVKLRPVTSKAGNDDSDHASTKKCSPVAADDSSDFRRIVVSKKKAVDAPTEERSSIPSERNGPEVIEIIDLANAPSTEENPIDLTNKSNEDKPIDLTSAQTPKTIDAQSRADTRANATTVTADGSVLVSLAPEPNSEPIKILIGKRGIVKIRSRPGETKARVIWRHDLDDVQSAMLDLASSKVTLLLSSEKGNKDLTFASSEQCMRFANALHEMTSAGAQEDLDNAISKEESVFVEQLNEEEQRVLDEFRQSKKQVATPFFPINTASDRPMSVVNANASVPSSPLSEISGPGNALSSADLRVAHSYQKMLKLRVPKDAVRHKMEKDNMNSKIIDFVLGSEDGVDETSSRQSAMNCTELSEEEEKAAAGYKRMLKMRIPPEAVRHKMEKEAASSKVVQAVLGNAEQQNTEHIEADIASTSPKLTEEEEKVAASYRKMLKMMIPKEAVEHKMKKDEIDQKVVASVLGIQLPSSTQKSEAKSGIPSLTDEEESVASSYRKMVGLRIPKEAIRQKMDSEGISRKIIAAVLGEKLNQDDRKCISKSKKGKQGFHWNPLVSSENLKNSVWSKASFDSGFLDDDDDISSHVEQFQKKVDNDDASRVTVKSSGDSKDKAKLIDLSRANNVAITLKAFNEFPQSELAQIIEFVDPFEKIKGDRALFMKDLLPAAAEIKVIKNYQDEEDRLVPAEKWFRQIVHIKRIEEKIHVLRTMESFRNEALALGETFKQLTSVCNQVMTSEKLPDLLEMVRQIGNRMNNGRGQEAAGFKLDFLPRLAQTKGSDKKTTALDLVVMIFSTRGRRDALLLREDFPECYEASRIQLGELISDVKMLSAAMSKCQKELETLRKETGKSTRAHLKGPTDTHSLPGAEKSRASDSSNEEEVRTQVSSIHEEMFSKRSQFLNSVLSNKPQNGKDPNFGGNSESKTSSHCRSEDRSVPQNSSYVDQHEKSYSQQGAINRIERFIGEAKIIFPELEAKRDQAVSACKELAEFFCESGGERIAPTLLGILSEFADNLNRAVMKYDHQQKAEARKKASKDTKVANKETDAPSKKPVTINNSWSGSSTTQHTEKQSKSSYQAEKKSLVLMVNEMLKMAGDKQREEYINGVTVENPDSRLKQIYEAEKELGKPIGSPATARKNILRTIEERRHLNGTHDSQAALSELASAIEKRTASVDSVSPTATAASDSVRGNRSVDGSITWGTDDEASETGRPSKQTKRKQQRMSIAERWTRKTDKEEEVVDDAVIFQVGEVPSIDKTDSQILASGSFDSADRQYEQKKRQECISRWASKNALLKSESNDDDNAPHVEDLTEQRNGVRQKYINRWASNPADNMQGESISLAS